MKFQFAGAVAALVLAVPAVAVTPTDARIPYVGAGATLTAPDSARDSDGEIGFRVLYGVPLSWPRSAIEFTAYGTSFERDIDGNSDYNRGVMVDYVHSLPLGVGPQAPQLFGLAGLGLVQDDARGDATINPGANFGIGVLWPVLPRGWSLRAELGALLDLASDVVPGEDALLDYKLMLGLQVPLRRFFDPPATAPEGCGLAVVDGDSRADCGQDSDRDGVSDAADRCPGTPAGQPVDGSGCAPGMRRSDGDGDGVIDAVDHCPGTVPGLAVDSAGCALSQTVVLEGVRFPSGSDELDASARAVLDPVVAALVGQPRLRLEIAGHTDDRGSAANNQALSAARATAVRAYLIAQGIDGARLVARGYGAREPVADNATAAGRASNRRVEFRIILD